MTALMDPVCRPSRDRSDHFYLHQGHSQHAANQLKLVKVALAGALIAVCMGVRGRLVRLPLIVGLKEPCSSMRLDHSERRMN